MKHIKSFYNAAKLNRNELSIGVLTFLSSIYGRSLVFCQEHAKSVVFFPEKFLHQKDIRKQEHQNENAKSDEMESFHFSYEKLK